MDLLVVEGDPNHIVRVVDRGLGSVVEDPDLQLDAAGDPLELGLDRLGIDDHFDSFSLTVP